MLRLASSPPAARVAQAVSPSVQLVLVPARDFTSEKALHTRIKSVKGIQKITKAVYMVASAKLRKQQARLEVGRTFAEPIENLWSAPESKKPQKDQKFVLVSVTSDRGLCGGFNSSVTREAKKVLNDAIKKYGKIDIITFGEKVKVGLERGFGEHFHTTISDFGKLPARTFRQTGMLVDFINNNDFDAGVMLFNRFKNLAAYDLTSIPMAGKAEWAAAAADAFVDYEIQGNIDTIDNLIEFCQAVRLWSAFVETDTSELSARTSAMQGASTNTKELLSTLSLQYNKLRQARITNELIEIISGATASDADEDEDSLEYWMSSQQKDEVAEEGAEQGQRA